MFKLIFVLLLVSVASCAIKNYGDHGIGNDPEPIHDNGIGNDFDGHDCRLKGCKCERKHKECGNDFHCTKGVAFKKCVNNSTYVFCDGISCKKPVAVTCPDVF